MLKNEQYIKSTFSSVKGIEVFDIVDGSQSGGFLEVSFVTGR